VVLSICRGRPADPRFRPVYCLCIRFVDLLCIIYYKKKENNNICVYLLRMLKESLDKCEMYRLDK